MTPKEREDHLIRNLFFTEPSVRLQMIQHSTSNLYYINFFNIIMSLFQKNKKTKNIFRLQEYSTRFFEFIKSGIIIMNQIGGVSME